MRHPMQAGALFLILFGNGVYTTERLLFTAVMVPMVVVGVLMEEKRLCRVEKDYPEYMKRVKARFIPFLLWLSSIYVIFSRYLLCGKRWDYIGETLTRNLVRTLSWITCICSWCSKTAHKRDRMKYYTRPYSLGYWKLVNNVDAFLSILWKKPKKTIRDSILYLMFSKDVMMPRYLESIRNQISHQMQVTECNSIQINIISKNLQIDILLIINWYGSFQPESRTNPSPSHCSGYPHRRSIYPLLRWRWTFLSLRNHTHPRSDLSLYDHLYILRDPLRS